MNNQKGITLIALVITVIVMIILAGVATYSGMDSVDETKKIAFISELETIQAKVNTIYEKRKTSEEEKNYYDSFGHDISSLNEATLTTILGGSSKEGFRYFSKQDLEKLDLDNITQNVIINFDTREVISTKGFVIDGKTYYKLSTIPDYAGRNVQYVDEDEKKTEDEKKPTFSIEKTKVSDTSYRFTIKDVKYNSNATSGIVSYRKQSETNWVINGTSLDITISEPGVYDFCFTDSEGNSTIKQDFMYVQEGLALYLDGELNTRQGQNVSSTVWEDLSGNSNDASGTGIGTSGSNSNGYYNQSEKGYSLVNTSSYFTTGKNIGITGDDKFTIETAMKPYTQNGNSFCTPLWFGIGDTGTYIGGAVIPAYNYSDKKFYLSFINKGIATTDTTQDYIGKNISVSWRKVGTGAIEDGGSNYAKINVNGTSKTTTYSTDNGLTPTITTEPIPTPSEPVENVKESANIHNSNVTIGNGWNGNSSTNASIQAVRIYNRELTDDEVKINYEIDKFRFNIQ